LQWLCCFTQELW